MVVVADEGCVCCSGGSGRGGGGWLAHVSEVQWKRHPQQQHQVECAAQRQAEVRWVVGSALVASGRYETLPAKAQE